MATRMISRGFDSKVRGPRNKLILGHPVDGQNSPEFWGESRGGCAEGFGAAWRRGLIRLKGAYPHLPLKFNRDARAPMRESSCHALASSQWKAARPRFSTVPSCW